MPSTCSTWPARGFSGGAGRTTPPAPFPRPPRIFYNRGSARLQRRVGLHHADVAVPLPRLNLEHRRRLDLHAVEDLADPMAEAEAVGGKIGKLVLVAAGVEALGAAEEDAELLSCLRERRSGEEQKQ